MASVKFNDNRLTMREYLFYNPIDDDYLVIDLPYFPDIVKDINFFIYDKETEEDYQMVYLGEL